MLAGSPTAGHDLEVEDEIVLLHDVTWADYLRYLRLRGEGSVPRLAYLEGRLELMTPSRSHEGLAYLIGRLVEVWCLERGVEFSGYGSWTLKKRREQRGVEPDECYVIGEVSEPKRPDLAIEVVWTHEGIRKLDIYRRLRVREVWYWRRGRISVHALRGDIYEEIAASEVLPGIDLDELASFLDRPTASRAIREYRARLQATS
jgi:Uma2 family endonuclease